MTTTATIQTTKLNRWGNYKTVLAKTDRNGYFGAVTYTNYKQAFNALSKLKAMGIQASIYDSGSVKFIEINQ